MYRPSHHVCIYIGRFEESLAYELKQFGIRTVISEPDIIRTNFQSIVAKKAVFDDNTNSPLSLYILLLRKIRDRFILR